LDRFPAQAEERAVRVRDGGETKRFHFDHVFAATR
jgi:hypothetical protein